MSETTIRDIEQISRNTKKPLNVIYDEVKIDYELKSLCFQSMPHASINELNNCYFAAKEARHIVSKIYQEAYY